MSMPTIQFRAGLLHPKNWGSWCLFGVWWLISQLPFSVLLSLGKSIGLLAFKFTSSRKSIAERNIELCFPNLNPQERHKMVRDTFINLGIALMEIGIAWWWSKKRFSRLVEIEGAENLTNVSKNGVLLLGIHYTTLEIGAAAATTAYDKVDGMYRAHGNPVYDFLQARGRVSKSCGDSRVFERKDVRGCLKALRNGRALWYGPDQDYGLGSGLFAPFFGIQAATVNATARFAQMSGATIVPFTHIRLCGTRGYKVTFYPALNNFPVGDDLEDATAINKLIEEFILLKPEQYLWVHRRFKTRPEGQKDFYSP